MRLSLSCLTAIALLAWPMEQAGRAQAPRASAWESAKPGNIFEVNEPVMRARNAVEPSVRIGCAVAKGLRPFPVLPARCASGGLA